MAAKKSGRLILAGSVGTFSATELPDLLNMKKQAIDQFMFNNIE
jgi:hypothetical protein